MKKVLEDRTIVVVGSWNLAILNPEWLTRNVFEADGAEMQIVISAGQPSLRYRHDSALLHPQQDKVVFSCLNGTDACSDNIETLAERLLAKLPVTPVSGIGINFGFIQEEVPENLADLFNTRDIAGFGQKDLLIREMTIARQVSFEDRELRLRLSITPENSLKVHLNFHKSVSTADEARGAIHGKSGLYKTASEDLLRDIYGLEMEEEA
jgi:hypothetical protein